jgi:hypothetical protein
VVALLGAGALLTGLLQTAEGTGAQAAAGSGSQTVAVALTGLSPRIPAAGDTLTLSGSVTNNGKSTITAAHVGVRMADNGPLHTRSDINSAASRLGAADDDGTEISGRTVAVASLAAGDSKPFTLKVPVSALDLSGTGVYQLGVSLSGQTAAEPYSHVLGIKRTFLPWWQGPDESAKATRMNYLWPLIDKPRIAARGDVDSQTSPIFLNDELAAELAPGGRLREMVNRGTDLPVTWVIDPDLLASVDAMAKGYRVAVNGDIAKTTPGTGTDVAKKWLNDLKGAVMNAEVIALPFGDTDLASMAHHGASVPGTTAHLKTADALGLSTVQTVLGVKARADVAWPVDGALDPSIVSVARGAGDSTIIARSDTFAENPSLPYNPTSARPIGGKTTAVVTDASLSTAFSGQTVYAQTANLAVQNFLAQSLLITMQAPQTQRTIVVAPQRQPTFSQADALADAIQALNTKGPWTSAVTFDTAAKTKPDPAASRKVPSAKNYPSRLRKAELSNEYFGQIHEQQKGLDGFVVILTRKDRVTVPFGNAILRAMSNGWRGDPRHAKAFSSANGVYLQDLIGAVHILEKTPLTLSGRSGTIPVTVKNDLGQAITGLHLRLTSGTTIRLEISGPQQPIFIEAGHTKTLKFRTTARGNGSTQITAALYSPDGSLYGGRLNGTNNTAGTIKFEVKITNVTDLVMLIIAAGLLLLVLAGVRIYRQRKRRAAAEGGGEGPDLSGDGSGDGSGEDPGDGRDPGQPGDPAADSGADSQVPSPAGEKVDG